MKIIEQTKGLILAIIAISLSIIIFFNPPTDPDGGPMMAYNLGFFFPLVSLMGIFSIMSIIISIKKLIHKKTERKTIQIISLSLSLLPVFYFLLIVISVVISSITADYDLDEYLIPEDAFNSSDSIQVTKSKTIYLVGYYWGRKLNNRKLYISLNPYIKGEFNFTNTYCYQGDSSMVIYYQVKSDSIFVYQSSNHVVYTHINATELNKIPLQTIRLSEEGLDSLITSDYGKKIRQFVWR